jgi:polar amino acid transport system substrate-binding protein
MTGRTTILQLGVGAILSLCVAMSAEPSAARTLQEILSSKKIRLGTIPYPPMTQLDSKTGKYSGLWIDGPKFMFEQLGIESEFVETKWATFPSALQSNQFDVFVGGSFATPRRAAAVDFSRPVMFMGHSVTIRKESAEKFKSMADLDKPGVTIATVLGTSGHEYMKQNFKHATIRALDTGDLTQDSLEVLAGRADAALQDAFKIAQVVARHPGRLLDLFSDNPFYVLPIAYALASGNRELLQLVNTSLEWMESSGKWQELARPYREQLGGVFYVERSYKPFSGSAAKAE